MMITIEELKDKIFINENIHNKEDIDCTGIPCRQCPLCPFLLKHDYDCVKALKELLETKEKFKRLKEILT